MKGKVRTAVIVLAVLVLAAVQAVWISQASAGGPWSVLWKDDCPAWGRVLTKTNWDGTTFVVCEVWDGGLADDTAH